MLVSEIFSSLQGEGRNQGSPCTFVRCVGCNLSCQWCDTVYAREGGTDMPVEEVADRVCTMGYLYACITGGEPLLQEQDVLILVRTLNDRGFALDIETNGTRDFSSLQPFASICMDVKCPSSGERSDLDLLCLITENDAVKFVVRDEKDCRYVSEVLSSCPIKGEVFISPVYGSDYQAIANYVLEHHLPVRYQLQLHRILGVR
ncbi:MAG: radical SAM protein [Methanomicrobiales archaeon]|nr:radical SAM protein [Methanomicrobiales archaeon]